MGPCDYFQLTGIFSRLRLLRALWGTLMLSALLLHTLKLLAKMVASKIETPLPRSWSDCVVYKPFEDLTYDVRQKWSFVYSSQGDTVFLYFCSIIYPTLTDKAIGLQGGPERCGFSSVVRRQAARKCIWGLEKLVTLFCGKTVSETFDYVSLRGKLCAYYMCVCRGRGCKMVVGAALSWWHLVI